MSIEQKLSQQLDLKISPQQLQLLSFLQTPNILFESKLKDEMEKNIALEIVEEDTQEAYFNNEKINEFNAYDNLRFSQKNNSYSNVETKEIENLKEDNTLFDIIKKQLGSLNLHNIEYKIAYSLIGNINEEGFLSRPIQSIVDDLMFRNGIEVDTNLVESVLKKIQTLEPIGIGAKNLQECLLIQLDFIAQNQKQENQKWIKVGKIIIEKYFSEFLHKNFNFIQKRLKIDEKELSEIIEKLSKLNPKPGNSIKTSTQAESIRPDFIVRINDNKIEIEFTKEHIPKMRVSNYYQNMYDEYSRNKNKNSKEVLSFLKEKIIQAEQLIQNVKSREHILVETMRLIAEKQKQFLLTGNEIHLVPLILKNIAEPLKISISTVSRIVSNKYVQTNFGVYSLKFFFGENFSNEQGDEINSREIKALIKEIITTENKDHPFTDEQIKIELEKRGFHLVRRTISKYRKDLGFATNQMRKKI